MVKKIILLCSIFIILSFKATSQKKCATVEYHQERLKENKTLESEKQFENWIKNKKLSRAIFRTHEAPYVIPVVFHIIHNGEPVGTGANIADTQIIEQIKMINKDFQRHNIDTVNTPLEFQHLAGSLDIEFVLAKQDPKEFPSTGIVRVNGGMTGWSVFDSDQKVKSISYWPSQDYLNVWVANLTMGYVDVLGYSQFPESDLVQGIDVGPTDAETDGIVVTYKAIGDSHKRVFTHEVGHFLGLRHIWGDDIDNCDGSGDYVNDTPPQSAPTEYKEGICPAHPFPDCDGLRMFQNYMDYTNDKCVNLFTKQQVERMRIILDNSPRRKSLSSSKGAIIPLTIGYDLGIANIVDPNIDGCALKVTPRIQVINRGTEDISSARIQISIDGEVKQIKFFDFVPPLSLFEVTAFPPYDEITMPMSGTYTFTFKIIQINDNAIDSKPKNDTISVNTKIPERVTVPFFETFNDGPSKWNIQNPDQSLTWESVDIVNDDGFANKGMSINFYDYYTNDESTDRLISPILLQSPQPGTIPTNATLKFDWCYSRPSIISNDMMRVIFTTGCDNNLDNGIEVFNKSKGDLTTTSSHYTSFKPTSISQWSTALISLEPEIMSLNNLQVAFIGTSGYGNNLYIDNVSISYPPKIDSPYRVHNDPTFKDIRITFNFKERKPVQLRVYSVSGITIYKDIIPDALDQTYIIPMEEHGTGIYILWIQFENQVETVRIFISP